MKIELKPYEGKYFFRYVFGIMNFKTLRNLGIFNPKILFLIVKNHLSWKSENYRLMIVYHDKIIGGVSLIKISPRVYRRGLFLFKKYRNKGIGTRASKEVVIFGEEKDWKKIVANTFIKNISAQRVLEKSGFKKVKINKRDSYWEKKLK